MGDIVKSVVATVLGAVIIYYLGIGNQKDQSTPEKDNMSKRAGSPPSTYSGNPNQKPLVQKNDERQISEHSVKSEQKEDFAYYVNSSLVKSKVSVTIIEKGHISTDISSLIAEIYRKEGRTVSTGLIRNSFVGTPFFNELREGNSEIIEKLDLSAYSDYLIIGEVSLIMRPGKLVDGSIVCNGSIAVTVISTQTKSIEQSFSISNANGNGADYSQARTEALQKLIDRYFNEHSSL